MRHTLNHRRRPGSGGMQETADRWLGSDEDLKYLDGVQRPRTRGECQNGERPCPWVSCKYHLALDVLPNGSIKLSHPEMDLTEMPETCALDVADRGGVDSLTELAEVTGLSFDRGFQRTSDALDHAFAVAVEMGLDMEPSRAGNRPPLSRAKGDADLWDISTVQAHVRTLDE